MSAPALPHRGAGEFRRRLPIARRDRTLVLVSVTAILLLAAGAFGVVREASADEPTQFQIETDLTCQCGCGLTVHSCNHLNCGSGIPLKKEIAEQLAQGKSRDQVLAHFQTKYGEKILSSPTTTGFNIAAWTVPFVVIAVGGLGIGFVLVRWRRGSADRAATPHPATGAPEAASDPERQARIERALADFDERS